MTWNEFDKENNFSKIVSQLSRKYINNTIEYLEEDNLVIALGVDFDSIYGDFFISMLTKNGEYSVPDWYEEWDWISGWDLWDIGKGFDQ
ncbi:MAG: hypothetical protein AAF934_12695, partial [Bacteroidota bacterium]